MPAHLIGYDNTRDLATLGLAADAASKTLHADGCSLVTMSTGKLRAKIVGVLLDSGTEETEAEAAANALVRELLGAGQAAVNASQQFAALHDAVELVLDTVGERANRLGVPARQTIRLLP